MGEDSAGVATSFSCYGSAACCGRPAASTSITFLNDVEDFDNGATSLFLQLASNSD